MKRMLCIGLCKGRKLSETNGGDDLLYKSSPGCYLSLAALETLSGIINHKTMRCFVYSPALEIWDICKIKQI